MLAQSAHHKPTFFTTPSILEKAIYYPLLRFSTPLPLTSRNFDESLENSFYSQGFWLPQSEALFFLCFEGDIASISIFVVNCFQRSVVEAANVFKSFRNRRST